jgi:hypothetical protein
MGHIIHIWVCLHCLHTSNIWVRLAPFQHATHSLVWKICLHFQIAMLYVQPFYQVRVYSIQVSCFQNPMPSRCCVFFSIEDGVPSLRSSRVGAYPRNQVDKSPPTPIRLQQFHKKIGHQSNQKIFSHSSRGKQWRNLMVKNCDKTANLTREKWKNGCLSHNKPLMQQFMMGSPARKNKTHGHFNNRNPGLQTWCPTYQLKNFPAMSAHHKLDLNVLGPIQWLTKTYVLHDTPQKEIQWTIYMPTYGVVSKQDTLTSNESA